MTIWKRVRIGPAPSTIAASRTSSGTVSNMFFITQTQIGRMKAASISATAGRLLRRS
jgi:hypothetical protein